MRNKRDEKIRELLNDSNLLGSVVAAPIIQEYLIHGTSNTSDFCSDNAIDCAD